MPRKIKGYGWNAIAAALEFDGRDLMYAARPWVGYDDSQPRFTIRSSREAQQATLSSDFWTIRSVK